MALLCSALLLVSPPLARLVTSRQAGVGAGAVGELELELELDGCAVSQSGRQASVCCAVLPEAICAGA